MVLEDIFELTGVMKEIESLKKEATTAALNHQLERHTATMQDCIWKAKNRIANEISTLNRSLPISETDMMEPNKVLDKLKSLVADIEEHLERN